MPFSKLVSHAQCGLPHHVPFGIWHYNEHQKLCEVSDEKEY